MAVTHGTRYEGKWFSSNGRFYHFKIYERDYAGQVIPLKVGSGGVKIKYDTSGQEKFSPIVASKCAISLVVENDVFGQHFEVFLKALRTTAEEGDATIVIWNTGGTGDNPLWSGNIMIDLSAKEDVSKPYEVELNATDGIGLLKNYDMVQTQKSNPYTAADTYQPVGWKSFTHWIKEILEFCNTPDADSTDGDVSDWKYSTSVDWWYEDHPSPDPAISPLAKTRAQMIGAYILQDDGRYKVKSVYKVLESICKMWGMRVVFWKNRFYFVQLELYKTPASGTFAVPDNIDTQIFNRNGTIYSGRSYVGENNFTAYSQDIETNAGGFAGGLQTLAGSKWDYYPKLKEVSVDFETISNNNYFQTFPQPYSSAFVDFSDNLTSSPIGVITDASTFGGFNINIELEFNNPTSALTYQWNFSVRARPNGDSDWDNAKYLSVQPGLTTSWANYPDEQALGADAVWFDYFTDQGASVAGYNYVFDNLTQYDIHPHVGQFNLPAGTSQHTIFSQQVPTDAAFIGDWEFEFFCMTSRLQILGIVLYGGHHVQLTSSALVFLSSVTYADVLDASGSPVSQFNPILNSVVGGTSTHTSVYSAKSDTQEQPVKDIWWGDTLTYGEPSSLQWDDGAGNFGYTDPAGKWRRGQSGTFNKSMAELLAESRLYSQQTSDYKWSVSTAVSDTNWWQSDGTAMRPVYVNPVGRIYDTVDQIFYYLLRGSFNILYDEWEGEWLQISYTDSISTTTTTNTTGGTVPDDNYAAARLSGGAEASIFSHELFIGLLSTRVAFASTVTSLTIEQMNPVVNSDETTYMFEQNTLIKSGDVFNVLNTGNGVWQQFTASADVSNTATTINVESIVIEKPLEVGSQIVVNIRDVYQQGNHKTRGTIAGMDVTATTIDDTSQLGEYTISYRVEGSNLSSDSSYLCNGEDNNRSGRFAVVNAGGFLTITALQAMKSSRSLVDLASKIQGGKVVISGTTANTWTLGLYKATPVDDSASDLSLTLVGSAELALTGNTSPRTSVLESLSTATIAAGDVIVPIISVDDSTTFRGIITFTLKYD